ncbi:MAG: hypothetical protein FJY07_05095 [Bacteroidetes bacterium]|nr:hypothetical protein [Bacteroidota bacterium]
MFRKEYCATFPVSSEMHSVLSVPGEKRVPYLVARVNVPTTIECINSATLYFLSFLLITFIFQIVTLLAAESVDIPAVFSNFKTIFQLPDGSALWSPYTVITVYGSGPFAALMIGLATIKMFIHFKRKKHLLKLFFLWCGLHSFNLVFGSLANGIICKTGFGFVPSWLYLNVAIQLLLIPISLGILILIGFLSNRAFTGMAFSSSEIKDARPQKLFKLRVAYLPWFICSILFFLAGFPIRHPYDYLIHLTMGIMLIPLIRFRQHVLLVKDSKIQSFNWIASSIIAILVASCGLFYLLW